MRQAGQPDGKIRIESYAFFLAFFGVILFLSHLPLLGLKYFWDEADQHIPMALDIFHRGSFIPHSVLPIIHPPGVFAYLAAMWKLVGYSPAATRSAMLLMASFGALVAFLLSIELSKE